MLCLSDFELYSRWVPLKRRQFPRGWRVAYRGFFPGGLSKIGELLIKNRFSVDQAFSFHCYRSSKQVFLERMSILRR